MDTNYTKTHAAKDSTDATIAKLNEVTAKLNALLAKLDADTGVNSTDYVATVGSTDNMDHVFINQ